MTKYMPKPVVTEAITFEELVTYGKRSGGYILYGIPWAFHYNGHLVVHENDGCYLIPTLEGTHKFTPKDMLITGIDGEIYPLKIDNFAATYERVDEPRFLLDTCNVCYGCKYYTGDDEDCIPPGICVQGSLNDYRAV